MIADIPPDETRLATRAGEELAARLAAEFTGGARRDVKVRRIVGRGLVNQVFVVEGEAGGESVVVRLCDAPYAAKQHEKEAWCIERARSAGVPGPRVLAVGTGDEGAAYMVESFVAGAAGDELPSEERLRVWRRLGEYARLIHAIDVEGFGVDLADFNAGDARGGWLRYVDYNVGSLHGRDELLSLGVLTREESARVRAIFEDLRGREFRFGLNHADLAPKNTIVGEGGGVTLLDWGSAAADIVPHHELLQLLKLRLTRGEPDDAALGEFLAGYGMTREEYGRLLPEVESLLLLRSFDLVRYALDRRREHVAHYAARARLALALKLGHS